MNKAIVISAVIVAVAILISTRYQTATDSRGPLIWVFDTWTGSVHFCVAAGRRDCTEIDR